MQTALAVFALLSSAVALPSHLRSRQSPDSPNPSSWPHAWPGQPAGPYSPSWQSYFEVDYRSLPNLTSPLSPFTSYAGSIATDTPGHPNNTLFFWAAEHARTPGSFCAGEGERAGEPWLVWLNGGPGSSSMLGFLLENGPLKITPDLTYAANNFSFNQLVDTVWVDNPVGTGWATADSSGDVPDETRMAEDFLGFLNNFVAVFPSLRTRPLILVGESYAGFYVPYISRALIRSRSPPVKLSKIALGNAVINNDGSAQQATTMSTLDKYPEIIAYNTSVYTSFLAEFKNCGYDLDITYPQREPLPPVPVIQPTDPESPYLDNAPVGWYAGQGARVQALAKRDVMMDRREWEERKRMWEESAEVRRAAAVVRNTTAQVDPWYGCYLYFKMYDYNFNYTVPWVNWGINVYDVPDDAQPDIPGDTPPDIELFLNNPGTVEALHAPTSKAFEAQINYPFGPDGDTSAPSITFLSEIADAGIPIVFYSGNDDTLVPSLGTEFAIQNTTFGDIRGFTQKPSTPWYTDDGELGGIVHQERNVSYVLVAHAGHQVPLWRPVAAYVFLREFLVGSNQTGQVIQTGSTTTVVGGENASLSRSGVPAGAIETGSGTYAGTYAWPKATVVEWETFVATRTGTPFE